MAASMDLTTLDDVKSYLGISGNGSDELLGTLIAAASEAIESYCGRKFASAAVVEYHDGGHTFLVLSRFPVSSVSAIYTDPSGRFSPGTLVPASCYVVYGEAGLVVLTSGVFPAGARAVKVSYTGGYASVPADIGQAATMLVATWYTRSREGADGLASQSVGSYSASFREEEWPAQVRALLRGYRLARV